MVHPLGTATAVRGFKPAPVVPLSEQIRRQLVDAVARGHLRPGDRLPGEATLAAQFGVSASEVRAGLNSLMAMGLVEIVRGRHGGVRIAQPKPDLLQQTLHDGLSVLTDLSGVTLQDLAEARREAETACARAASRRRTEDDLRAMRAALDRSADQQLEISEWLALEHRLPPRGCGGQPQPDPRDAPDRRARGRPAAAQPAHRRPTGPRPGTRPAHRDLPGHRRRQTPGSRPRRARTMSPTWKPATPASRRSRSSSADQVAVTSGWARLTAFGAGIVSIAVDTEPQGRIDRRLRTGRRITSPLAGRRSCRPVQSFPWPLQPAPRDSPHHGDKMGQRGGIQPCRVGGSCAAPEARHAVISRM